MRSRKGVGPVCDQVYSQGLGWILYKVTGKTGKSKQKFKFSSVLNLPNSFEVDTTSMTGCKGFLKLSVFTFSLLIVSSWWKTTFTFLIFLISVSFAVQYLKEPEVYIRMTTLVFDD